MKAMTIERRGDAGEVRSVPVPKPDEREILVRITVAGVNPVDWKTRDRGERKTPFVLGQDFAGIVAGVGSGVTRFRPETRIFGIAREHGAYAEYTIVPENDSEQPVAAIPDGVGDFDAAALPTAGLTALACLDALRVSSGATLLVLGVTGGVGNIITQIAVQRKIRVIGVAHSRSESNAREAGVGEFIAYDRDDTVTAALALCKGGVDGVLDLVDDSEKSKAMIPAIKKGGTIVSTIGALDEKEFAKAGITAVNLVMNRTSRSSPEGLTELATMVESGALKVPIESRVRLEDAASALERSKSGQTNGKIVLVIKGETN